MDNNSNAFAAWHPQQPKQGDKCPPPATATAQHHLLMDHPQTLKRQQQQPALTMKDSSSLSPHLWRRTRSLDEGNGGRCRRPRVSNSPYTAGGHQKKLDDNDDDDGDDVVDENRLEGEVHPDVHTEKLVDNAEEEEEEDSLDVQQQQPLHSSFDAALLESDLNSIFRTNNSTHSSIKRRSSEADTSITTTTTTPWNNRTNGGRTTMFEVKTPHSSGRKHLRQPRASFQEEEEDDGEDHAEEGLVCPGTVRKLARHNSNESSKSRGTPVRPLNHWGIPTTSSSALRPGSSTSSNHAYQAHPTRSVWKAPRVSTASSAAAFTYHQQQHHQQQQQHHQQQHQHPPPLTPTAAYNHSNRPPPTTQPRQFSTGGTSHSTLESTPSTDSPTNTPFRFTSFPASLPRIHPPLYRDNSANADSVRKRMFLPPSVHNNNNNHHHHQHQGNNTHHNNNNNNSNVNFNNQSREEDGTQNTSISSLSTQGGLGEEDDEPPSQRMPAVHTRLFLDDQDYYAYSDDDDDDDEGQDATNNNDVIGKTPNNNNNNEEVVGRTRLDFNNLAALHPHSPKNLLPSQSTLRQGGPLADFAKRKGLLQMRLEQPASQDKTETLPADLSRPYEPKHVHSFPSVGTTSTAGLTGSGGPMETINHHPHSQYPEDHSPLDQEGPATPREVQLHFQLDNEDTCSPIPGIPEEEEMEGAQPPVLKMGKPGSRLPPKPRHPTSSSTEDCTSSSHRPPQPPHKPSSNSNSNSTKEQASLAEEARHSFSAAESVSSSTSSRMRRRPMPDMSAFEADAGSKNGHDRSLDDMSGDTTSHNNPSHHQAAHQSPKLLCPPTPERTPAWAHVHHRSDAKNGANASARDGNTLMFHRANSLITTRVLATCSDSAPEDSQIEATLADGDQEMTHTDDGDDEKMAGPAAPMLQGALAGVDASHKHHTGELGTVISFSTDFESLGILGRGAFADVFKVRSKMDNKLYAVKRNRRHFRGKRDRDIALAEVRSMQRLQQQSSQERQQAKAKYLQYLLFFFRAWQEDGHFFCQTELCCRDTCRELMDSLRSQWNTAKTRYPSLLRNLPAPKGVLAGGAFDVAGRIVPDMSVWKICHDICAGLSHIHSCGLVHNDIKPSNIFFVGHPDFGCLCKIGDFGMAGPIGTSEDGQEGDQKYMAPELLSCEVKHASSDIFSFGLTLYELASDLSFELPKGGPRWHELRNGTHFPELHASTDVGLGQLIQLMISPAPATRPTASSILSKENVQRAGSSCDVFLRDYIADLEAFDKQEEERRAAAERIAEDQTPRTGANGAPCRIRVCSPTFTQFPTTSTTIFTPEAQSSSG